MITSRADLDRYRREDAAAHGVPCRRGLIPSARSSTRIFRFQWRLRTLEYLVNAKPGPSVLRRVALAVLWRVHARHAERLGFTVPINTCGPGLCLVHAGTIVINESARIGADARIHPSSSIGRDSDGAPTLGDGCYVGPGARIVGPVVLGSSVIVGANAVVLSSFPSHTVLGGVPAKQIGKREDRGNIH